MSDLPIIPAKNEEIAEGECVVSSLDLITGDVLITFAQAFAYYLQEAQKRIGIVRVLRHIETKSYMFQSAACELWEGVLRDRGLWPEGPKNGEQEEAPQETPT